MTIHFAQDKWRKIKDDASRWWAGTLDRPLIQVRLLGRKTEQPEPRQPYYNFTSFYDLTIPAEDIVEAWDYRLSCTEHLGDAFPVVWPNFGAGAIAAYMGAILENGNETAWFYPEKEVELSGIQFEYLPDNKWLRRTKEIIETAVKYWAGSVQISMPDLGGNLDILSTFRPSEKLLLDLYDQPEDVERLIWKAHRMWWHYFDEFNALLKPTNPGYSTWARIISEQPHYMLQCDFCYMIGPAMFERFVQPELVATSRKLVDGFYHLDGPGQLRHLDRILEIDSIKGIQWVPGAGQPDISKWPDVHKKITDAGKKIHLASNRTHDPLTLIDEIAQQTGRVDNIVYHYDGPISQKDQAIRMLEIYRCI